MNLSSSLVYKNSNYEIGLIFSPSTVLSESLRGQFHLPAIYTLCLNYKITDLATLFSDISFCNYINNADSYIVLFGVKQKILKYGILYLGNSYLCPTTFIFASVKLPLRKISTEVTLAYGNRTFELSGKYINERVLKLLFDFRYVL
jgi:hypothetical protein